MKNGLMKDLRVFIKNEPESREMAHPHLLVHI
jgi:hypothetical protein